MEYRADKHTYVVGNIFPVVEGLLEGSWRELDISLDAVHSGCDRFCRTNS